jgi:23S rRNA (cytosine1962-C5)-methyltransferase
MQVNSMPVTLFAPETRRRLLLKPGKERVIANRHPWIFAGAIAKESGKAEAAFADLVDNDGKLLASGFYSQHSQIRLRALTFGDEALTEDVFRARIDAAFARRTFEHGNSARLVNSEGDDLSGLVVDLYDDLAVVEIANRGLELVRDVVVDALRAWGVRLVYFKNDIPARTLEHLPLADETRGEGPPTATIVENGLRFAVEPAGGQKTGFFLDQRENRQLTRGLAEGRRVLNLFSYTGAFGVYAAAGGATHVDNVDVSAAAIEMAKRNYTLNGVEAAFTVADAFSFLRHTYHQGSDRWDLIICDPPAFAKSHNDVGRAARGYKDINLYALRLLNPGGMLMTFSCSGHLSGDLFQKIVFSAALDSGRRASFVRRLTAAPDHPVSLFAPEGEYLKGMLVVSC